MAPLMATPDGTPFATAQGTFTMGIEERPKLGFSSRKGTASGRISNGGVLVSALPAVVTASATPKLSIKNPDLMLASRIATVINKAAGAGTARVEDPGSIALKAPAGGADSLPTFLAALDTLQVDVPAEQRIVIDARNGVVASGGDLMVGNASVTLRGITLRIGDSTSTTQTPGLVAMAKGATVRDVAAGLHAMGAIPSEVASVFDALRASGAVTAQVVIR
jgi:flagellar P-ring protein precursor FlgI